MLEILEWYGAISAVVAALVVAGNLGPRITGWAFVLFVSSSLALLSWGFLSEDADGIAWQNVCLLLINGFGVYRYLLGKPAQIGRSATQGLDSMPADRN